MTDTGKTEPAGQGHRVIFCGPDAIRRHLVLETEPLGSRGAVAVPIQVLGEAERQFLHAMVTDKEMVLEAGAGIFTQAWLACALDRLFGPPPKLTNFDGEEVVFRKARFRIEGGSDEIERRLDGAKWLERQAPVRARWSWLGRDSAAQPKLAGAVSMAMWKGPGEQVLGFVELGDKHLVHFGWILEKFGLRPAALGQLLDPYEYELVRSCALEDFFTQRFGSERRNVVDEYLERHGAANRPGRAAIWRRCGIR
jgi:hypothetical protein